ncbi:hypothetical protein B0H16DRAFT_1337809 [Mycena metata]|uniref:CxC5 like cysteine cluster associated with KDZ domain-containing protein n=1 Tax=Mycena metata TaxID=1033252 RepID=A0AAD7HD00_9AGAR|nr:hypothetical protein B0H16DRAFT_1337809 [Mycena metata]
MIPTLGNFILILQLYFIDEFSLKRAFYILTVLSACYPLFRLHLNQRRGPRQPTETAWLRSIFDAITKAFDNQHEHPDFPPDADGLGPQLSQKVRGDLEQLFRLLGVDEDHLDLFPHPSPLLVTDRLCCIFCSLEERPQPLSRHNKPQEVKLLNSDFCWVQAQLFVAYCVKCKAEYYPDRITFQPAASSYGRVQRLEYGASCLRVSKHGIWMHRRVAWAQEHAILRFHSSWSSFADWLNDTMSAKSKITTRQSQRLYFEHFARRLIESHNLEESFTVPAHSKAEVLAKSVRNLIGRNGGVVAGAMDHGCTNCTHIKRYPADLRAEGATFDADSTGVVDGGDNSDVSNGPGDPNIAQIPAGLPSHPTPQERQPGTGRGYARLAVMDGKTIPHKICGVGKCEGPLVNYKNGRFCQDHLFMRDICGIIPCGRAVHSQGAVTCDNQLHKDWHAKDVNRFYRLSFPGVQRVIRRQNQSNSAATPGQAPALHSDLPQLGETPGDQVVHTFRARKTYCLQTVQWACGCPIGWGKCYDSEGSVQVLAIIDNIWAANPDSKPSFLAYDDACNLLRHIVTQDPNSPWLSSTRFIVDAWHYIGHRATDILCRIWCNPAPTTYSNGSQPDLIAIHVDSNGNQHTTRAFNTETAEQLNAWLNGYEAQLRHMSDINYDFSVHVLMLLYKGMVERRVESKGQSLSEEFWEKVRDAN